MRRSLKRSHLTLGLALFFLALAIPAGVLCYEAYDQLKWEAFHRQRQLAEELTGRIDARLTALIAREEQRAYTDYRFTVVTGSGRAQSVVRSPLAALPGGGDIPGLLGHFQIDASGRFSSPLAAQDAAAYDRVGLSQAERQRRGLVVARLRQVLEENALLASPQTKSEMTAGAEEPTPVTRGDGKRARLAGPSAAAAAPSRALDQLRHAGKQVAASEMHRADSRRSLGRIDEAELDDRYTVAPASEAESVASSFSDLPAQQLQRGARKELNVALADSAGTDGTAEKRDAEAAIRITSFESELEPFEFAVLTSGHFVLFRKVWREGQRIVQGALIERAAFLAAAVETPYRATVLSRTSSLGVAYRGEVLRALSAQPGRLYLESAAELSGALLARLRLSAPFSELELAFTAARLPVGPGARVIAVTAAVLAVVLLAGFALAYRLAARQLDLIEQQRDFVSAVSHELRTPLTSIRMYAEMLREGWASESKQREYHDYILGESERLSRLIANVLQLARISRAEPTPTMLPVAVASLMQSLQAKVDSQVHQAGFTLEVRVGEAAGRSTLHVDEDLLAQVVINLVDNALKFSAKASRRQVDLSAALTRDGALNIAVRDYGPGVPTAQARKVFALFYRAENELTRETVGTGIGLALVKQLAESMGAAVHLSQAAPGARFTVRFPASALAAR